MGLSMLSNNLVLSNIGGCYTRTTLELSKKNFVIEINMNMIPLGLSSEVYYLYKGKK